MAREPLQTTAVKLREFVLFNVGDMHCGLETSCVQEIFNKNTEITVVHRAPQYVRGVINLRGDIVTIIDLRLKFGFEPLEIGDATQIVVVRHGDESIGLLVDSVSDVVSADPADIEAPPSNVGGITGAYFDGIYKLETELVVVLDKDELLRLDA